MRFALVAVFALLTAGTSAATAQPQPRNGRWLLLQLASQAEHNGSAAENAGDAKDAKTWRAWGLLYRKQAVLPQVDETSALDLVRQAEQNNLAAGQQAEAAHQADAAAFWHASHDFWVDIDHQLLRGGPLAIRFPEHAMLTPLPGVPGTPWGQNGPKVTAADCASLAQRVSVCQTQLTQMQHEQITGLYGDQGFPIVMKMHECNRWREMQVAYCVK